MSHPQLQRQVIRLLEENNKQLRLTIKQQSKQNDSLVKELKKRSSTNPFQRLFA